ncbi:MAG: ATP-binding cassette domain-containing protein [Bacteroidales bacterium]|nr:ATP-binding cassette domain-containing protein [Bacteroidales bacterium]
MISINNISIHFTGDELFRDISFIVNDKDRIGLTGKNGAGKTTLLKIIAGLQQADTGSIAIPSGQKIGYLPQEKNFFGTQTVYEEAKKAFAEVLQLDAERKKLTQSLEERTDYHSDDYLKLCERLTYIEDRFLLIGGATMEADVEKILCGLGFKREEFDRPINTFSNGWQMRIELTKLLLQRPDLLLMDEPTNHLDIESIRWLEEYMENFSGAVILVSHDRAFLDNVTTRTIEISLGKIYDYKAGYSDYLLMRQERQDSQMAAFSNQQQQIAQIERFIDRFRYKSTKAKQVQSRVKMLDKLDKVEVDLQDKTSIHFRFPQAPPSGKIIFEAEALGKKYDEKWVLQNLNFMIIRGERIAYVGRNGEGKTTLARMLVGDLDYTTGILKRGHQVTIGYYPQNPEALLDMDKTVFQTIDDVAVGDMRTKTKNLLGSFLFAGDALDKKVKVLSGGEKARLALAKLLLFPVNMLVLDEPTNHLDMRSKDILKSALLQFDGTVVIVSHDRDFLTGLTTKTLEFRDRKIFEHIGDVSVFLEHRNLEHLKALEETAKAKQTENRETSQNKLDYEQRKQLEREKRKISSQVEKCETEIERIESEMKKLDAILANPTDYQEQIEIYKQYSVLKQQLEDETLQWETWSEKLEKMS